MARMFSAVALTSPRRMRPMVVLADAGFFRQFHLGAQMGVLFHEHVELLGDDFSGFLFHGWYPFPVGGMRGETFFVLSFSLKWSIMCACVRGLLFRVSGGPAGVAGVSGWGFLVFRMFRRAPQS